MLAGLASSGVRSSTSVCVKWMSFTPALQRWFPGHGQPWYCLFKATDMPGILETKENQNLTKCASSHGGFPKVCMDPNAGSGTLASVTAETRKLEAERILGGEAKKRTVFLGLCSNICGMEEGEQSRAVFLGRMSLDTYKGSDLMHPHSILGNCKPNSHHLHQWNCFEELGVLLYRRARALEHWTVSFSLGQCE